MGRLLQLTPRLQMLDVYNCDLHIPEMLQAAGEETLSHLRILDLGGYNTDPQLSISDSLPSMPHLQALSVSHCAGDDDHIQVHNLLRLVASLPPSLTHLNVSNITFLPSVLEVVQQKERLVQLHRLNIGRRQDVDDVDAIREEVQQLNPDVQVYCDLRDRLWQMDEDVNI